MFNNNLNEPSDDKQTAIEHEYIILHYVQTGYLDRTDAIKKFKKFNDSHPEYALPMQAGAKASGSAIQIELAPDNVIIGNLNQQLFYLAGKNLLGGQKNG